MHMIGLGVNNKTALLSNMTFDHPLTDGELNDLIITVSSPMSLQQIYFKGEIDISSIERIKLLLESLPNVEDAKIEKYIMKSIDITEKEELSNMNFLNIDTWNIAYSIEDNKYSITPLAKYRLVNDWFDNVIKEMDNDLSIMDKVCYLYDKVKLFEFNSQSKYGRIPEIISSGVANDYGYNLIFKELLTIIGIPAKIESYELEEETNYLTIAKINDKQNEVNGIYLFAPSLDSISKGKYKNNVARRLNYNFFCISLDKFSRLNGQVVPYGLLKVLMSDQVEYKYYLDRLKKQNDSASIEELETVFKQDMASIYTEISNSFDLSQELKFKILSNSVEFYQYSSSDDELLRKVVIDNYKTRDEELFYTKSVKCMSKKNE